MFTPNYKLNKNITQAYTLPAEFYLNKFIFEIAKDKIFAPSWQLITDIDALEKNNIYPFSFLQGIINEPLVLTKEKNKISCLSNVCTHRAHLAATTICNAKKLHCKYHGRNFCLDGKFYSMPGFEKVENFPDPSDNLTSIPIKIWKNFIFVSLEGGVNISPALEDIQKRIPAFPFAELQHDETSDAEWIIDAHWALYCENYLEGFHVPFVHKGLAKELEFGSYETILLDQSVLQIGEGKNKISILKNPETPNRNIYGLYYWIFPNLMLNFYEWGLSINIIEPIAPGQTRVRFLSFPINSKKQPKEGDSALGKVELEDQDVVLNVQKGIKSRFYSKGRYSPEHEKGIHYFHLILSKYLS